MPAENIHATAVILGERGILVTGPSGSGKTTLALAIIHHFGATGFARLVGDDQLFVENRGGRLLCRAPETIAGLVEVPGLGPRSVIHEPAAVIDLAVRLVPQAEMARFQDDMSLTVAGCTLALIELCQRNVDAALPALRARLGHAPFV